MLVLIRPEDGGTTLHQNVGNHLPVARRNIPEEVTLHQHSCEILINTRIYDY